jgi:hypothetical protein
MAFIPKVRVQITLAKDIAEELERRFGNPKRSDKGEI